MSGVGNLFSDFIKSVNFYVSTNVNDSPQDVNSGNIWLIRSNQQIVTVVIVILAEYCKNTFVLQIKQLCEA